MDSAKQDKKNIIWNGIAAIVQACQSVVTVMVVTRIDGLNIAGAVTIAFSIANLFLTLGKFGMRNYQIAHEGFDEDFDKFKTSRIITTAMMAGAIIIYLLIRLITKTYSLEKIGIVFGICFWYIIDSFEDVYIAGFQSRGKLDIGNKVFVARWVLTLLTFILIELFSKKIFIAILVSCIVALVVEVIGLLYYSRKYKKIECQSSLSVKELLVKNIPLCVAAFVYFYMTNISRYAIDNMLDDKTQAIYGYIAMPVFVISLLSNIIYQPQLMYYIEALRNGKIKEVKTRIKKQILIIGALLAFCLVVAFFIGIPVLSWLYHVDLKAYKMHMLIALLGSAFLAIGTFISTILILMNKLKLNMFLYIGASIIGTVLIFILTAKFKMTGAVIGFLITMIISAISFVVAIKKKLDNYTPEVK